MSSTVLIPIAQGTEEMEAVIPIDVFRRASIKVSVISENNIVTCSHGIKLIPDILYKDLDPEDEFDAIFLPGGLKGTTNFLKNEDLKDILVKHNAKSKLIAAVCAAPTVLSEFKILTAESTITSHPSVKEQLQQYHYREESIVLWKNIITSRGAGTVLDMALRMVEMLGGTDLSSRIAANIVYNRVYSDDKF